MNVAKLASIQDYDQRKRIMMLSQRYERMPEQERIMRRLVEYYKGEKSGEKWRKT